MIATPSRRTVARAGLLMPALLLGAGLGAYAAARPTPVPHAPKAPPVARVAIAGYAFRPKTLTVAPGTRVTWTNTDSGSHTIVSDTGAFTASATLATGHSFTHTFSTTGTYRYHCGLHAFMIGRVVVQSPTHAKP